MPSPKQSAFIATLTAERTLSDDQQHRATDPSLSVREASQLIDELLGMPRTPVGNPVTDPGMYRQGGELYKIQLSRSGNLYAKRLVQDGHRWQFEYAPGVARKLTPADRMTIDQARSFGAQFGTCVVCGRTLTDPKSIDAGIGPVCAGRV